MFVVAIIAILAAIALPSNVGRLTRHRVNETISLVTPYQYNIKNHYKDPLTLGTFPEDNLTAGIPEPEKILGKYLKRMEVNDGAMHLILGQELPESLHDKIVSLRPIYVEDNPDNGIEWICGHANIPNGMLAAGENLTDIDPLFLPPSCR